MKDKKELLSQMVEDGIISKEEFLKRVSFLEEKSEHLITNHSNINNSVETKNTGVKNSESKKDRKWIVYIILISIILLLLSFIYIILSFNSAIGNKIVDGNISNNGTVNNINEATNGNKENIKVDDSENKVSDEEQTINNDTYTKNSNSIAPSSTEIPRNSTIIKDNPSKITIGTTKEEVLEIMGTPDIIYENLNQWNYNYDSIGFDRTNRVSSWSNTNGNLKVELGQKKQTDKKITLGTTKEEVIEIMGTPDIIYENLNQWNYNYDSISFDRTDRVSSWSNTNGNLKVEL